MTFEAHAHDEANGGPEFDHTLPDAIDLPVYDSPEASDAPPFDGEGS